MRHENSELWLVCDRSVDATDVFDPHTPCDSCWTDSIFESVQQLSRKLVKSTNDDRLWCAHTMRFSSFRRLCVQQKTKIAWCVPGFMYHKGWRTYVLSQILSVTHPSAVGLRSWCRPLTSVSFNYAPSLPPFMLPFRIIFDIYIIKLRMWRDGSRLAAVCLGRWKLGRWKQILASFSSLWAAVSYAVHVNALSM